MRICSAFFLFLLLTANVPASLKVGVTVLEGEPVELLSSTNGPTNLTLNLQWCGVSNTMRETDFYVLASPTGVLFSTEAQSTAGTHCMGLPSVPGLRVGMSASFRDRLTVDAGPFEQLFIRYRLGMVSTGEQQTVNVGHLNNSLALLRQGVPVPFVRSVYRTGSVETISAWLPVTNGQPFDLELRASNTYDGATSSRAQTWLSEIELGAYGATDWTQAVSVGSSHGTAWPVRFSALQPCSPSPLNNKVLLPRIISVLIL
ncbi:MAG: hypothetical protein AAF492_02210 [Verrucomicrobiota bacterium]